MTVHPTLMSVRVGCTECIAAPPNYFGEAEIDL